MNNQEIPELIKGDALKDIHSKIGFFKVGFKVGESGSTATTEPMYPDAMSEIEFETEVPEGSRFLSRETISTASCLHHAGIKGVYEPERLLGLAAKIANGRYESPNGHNPELPTTFFIQRTSTGGHVSPSIVFPSYFMPSIQSKTLLERRHQKILGEGRTIPYPLEITPEWMHVSNASKIVNHYDSEERNIAIDLATRINHDLSARYFQWKYIREMTEFNPKIVNDSWVDSPQSRALAELCDPILTELENTEPTNDLDTIARDNLMALYRIGSNHGRGRNEQTSRMYISWHLLIMRDLDFEGNGTQNSIINFNKRDESRFYALRKYLLTKLQERDVLQGFEVNPRRLDIMTKVNSDDPSYYPSDFLANVHFGEWINNRDQILRYLTDSTPYRTDARNETSRQAQQRIFDAMELLGVNWEKSLNPSLNQEQIKNLLISRAQEYYDEILIPCEEANREIAGNLTQLHAQMI